MQRTRRSKLVRARSGGRRSGRPQPPQVEKLEDRTLLTVNSIWDAAHGILSVVSDANDAIAITASGGNVKVNGADPSGPVLANAVQRLNLTDTASSGPGGSTFNLGGVLHAGFPALTRIQVTGGGGSNTLIGPNLSLTWDITGADSGDVLGMTAPVFFSSVGNLDGGTVADDFAFSDGGSLSGSITGGDGTETLDFSACNNPVAVTLTASAAGGFQGTAAGYLGSGFTGIGALVGGNASSTLTGENLVGPAASTWTLASTGTYSDGSATLNFNSFATLQGGTGLNTFDILTDVHDLGLVTADLYGGPDDNTFSFQGGTDLQGSVFGGGGVNTIDDTLFGSGLGVALTGYDTTGYAGTQFDTTFHDINAVNVPSGTGSTLIGDSTLSTWSLAAGTYSDGNPALTFTGFSSLAGGDGGNVFNVNADTTIDLFGGAGDDTFAMSPGVTLTGSIDGGVSGSDTISYAGYSTAVTVDLTAGTATAVTGTVTNVANATGGSGDDTLTGADGTNRLTPGAGHNTLFGGTGDETYALTPGGGSSDVIHSGSGTNTLDFSGAAAGVTIDLDSSAVQTVSPGGTVQLLGAVQSFIGSPFNDTIDLGAGSYDSIDGGAGSDTLDFNNAAGAVSVALTGSGSNGFQGTATGLSVGFSNIDTIHDSTTPGTLTGEDVAATWALAGGQTFKDANGNTLGFSGFGALQGGSGADIFNVTVATTQTINGRAGSDTLSVAGDVTLTGSDANGFSGTNANVGGFSGIDVLQGSGKLTGDNNTSLWSLGNTLTYNDGVATLTFSGYSTIQAGSGANTFVVTVPTGIVILGGSGSGTLNVAGNVTLTGSTSAGFSGTNSNVGSFTDISTLIGGGSDQLTGENAASTWTVGVTQTYFDGSHTLTFSGYSTLQGGSGADSFNATVATAETFLGGAGSDTLNNTGGATLTGSGVTGFSGTTTGGGGFDGIDTLSGSGTLTGENVASTWSLAVSQTYSDGVHTLPISGFSTMQGGSAVDTFNIAVSTTANLGGGGGNDIFVFTPGALLTGSIDGGPGHDTLNYSSYTTPVNVNLAIGAATAVSGSVTHVETAIGPPINGNILIGDDTATVGLGTTTPLTNDVLTATATTFDPDGQSVTLTYVWKVNGNVVKTTTGTASLTDTLNLALAGNGNKGDSIAVTVTPFDGDLFGAPVTNAPAVVKDSAPAMTSVGINPANPFPGQLLTAVVAAHDDDGDHVSYTYQWLRNSNPIGGATSSTLDLSHNGYGAVGDVIAVRVTPSDGTLLGTALSGSSTLVGSVAATFVIGTDHLIYELKLDNLGNPTGGYILVSSLQARSVAVGQDALGRTELFVLGMDHQVWAFHLDATGHAVADCFLVAPGQVKALSVTRTAQGNPEVFVIGTDNQVRADILNANGTAGSGYFLTAPGQVKGISATQDAAGNPLVFTIGTDNQVRAEDFDATGHTSGGYFLVAMGTVQAIKAGRDASGQPLLLAIKADGQVWGHTLDNTGHGTGNWYLTHPGQAQSLNWCVTTAGNIDLFVLGTDHRVLLQKLNGSGQSLGAYALAAPGVVNDLANDGNLSGLSPALVDYLFALIPPPSTTVSRGRRSGP